MERSRSLPVSVFESPAAKHQTGFIDFVLHPYFTQLNRIAPVSVTPWLKALASNKESWKKEFARITSLSEGNSRKKSIAFSS
jgi:hypothetical protein